MSGQIKISSICQPEELFSAERIVKFKIYGSFGIMRPVFRRNFKLVNTVLAKTDIRKPFQNFRPEIFKNFFPFALSCEILYFHLLKFPRAKKKIPRRYFVPESFANLSQTKRQFRMERIHHILEIHKHSLR